MIKGVKNIVRAKVLKRTIFINPYSGDGVYKYDNPSTNPNNIKIETISLNLFGKNFV